MIFNNDDEETLARKPIADRLGKRLKVASAAIMNNKQDKLGQAVQNMQKFCN